MENKYYDHLKPQLPQQNFSDVVNQQLQIVQQQQQQRLAQQMLVEKEQRKMQDAQQQELLGFDVSKFSDVDKQVFGAKRDWLADRINNFHYTGRNRSDFVTDVTALKTSFETLEQHHKNTNKERDTLEGYVSGTQPWTDKVMQLGDNKESLDYKVQQWNNSGVEPDSIEIDPNTGDAYAYYVDINGTRMQGEDGKDMYGLVSQSPTRGSKEHFAPTVSPYANLLPGEFSKDYASAATRLKKNENLTYEEKLDTLRSWVTADAMKNQAVGATARSQFVQNYGESVHESVLQDDQTKNGQEPGYVSMDVREYVDETMRFLEGNLMDAPDDDDDSAPSIFPSSVEFKVDQFQKPGQGFVGPIMPGSEGDDEKFGSGISSLMVPKSGVGKSSITVEKSYIPQNNTDPRANEVSDQYRVLGVAMDNSDVPKLFVRAEMYLQKNINDLDPTYAATLQGYDINIDGKTVDKKEAVNIVVDAYTPDGETNQEYISILAQLGYASGVKDGERNEAIKKGVEVLRTFNDSEAQIFASQPRP
jgi:hypothetical protein